MNLAACGFATLSDRYGNEYGNWYNPGDGFIWQIGLCEHEMEVQRIPQAARKAAMRCCMHNHGVPDEAGAGCGSESAR
jgi:hypothetical protein